MKKLIAVLVASGALLTSVAAYNPPVGSENMEDLAGAEALSGKLSVTGGAIFSAGPDAIVANPALTADEQRVNLNAGYTFMYSTSEYTDLHIGNAFQSGILIPFKLYIFSGYVNGIFVPFPELPLGNNINAKAGLSKEITDKLNVGASLSGGITWGHETDWALGANLGFLYKYGDLGFIKNFRYGVSVLNLGKNFINVQSIGSDIFSEISQYPTIATVKAGVAGSFIKTDDVELGVAIDFTTPCFQNLIVDFNTQFAIKDTFFVSIGEKFNLIETIRASQNKFLCNYNLLPSIGLSFKFSFDVHNNDYMESNGWSQSEMTVSTAYKNMYENIHAGSAAVDIDLGMKDKEPPKIILIDMED